MLRPRLFRSNGRSIAQALVEFSLTIIPLLMMLMLIIEVARIFQAYVTLQGAARAGARYAVTGQWDAAFAGSQDDAGIPILSSGWDPRSNDPLLHIPPCWPRFKAPLANGGPYYTPMVVGSFLKYYPYTQLNSALAEPYRDPRTCSIEATVIRGLTGLPLDPRNTGGVTPRVVSTGPLPYTECCWAAYDTAVNRPYTYTISVLGYAAEQFPQGGPYGHPDYNDPTKWNDSDDYESAVADGLLPEADNAGFSYGYGGDPGQQVNVRIEYRLGMITPILSRIVPYVRLTAVATMTNEQFGSTGVQSNAVLPPPLPPIEPPDESKPPDLVVDSISCPDDPCVVDTATGVMQAPPNQPLHILTAEYNQGDSDTVDITYVTMYYLYMPPTSTTTPPIVGTDGKPLGMGNLPTDFVQIGEQSIPAGGVIVNSDSKTLDFPATFTAGGKYYIYVFADSHNTIDEIGNGLSPDPTHEENNVLGPKVAAPFLINIDATADLVLTKTVSKRAPATGEIVKYTITIQNLGIATATGVVLNDPLPAGLALVAAQPSSATLGSVATSSNTVTWTIPSLKKGVVAILTIPAQVTAATGSVVKNAIPITSTGPTAGLKMDSTLTDPIDTNDNRACTIPSGQIDDCKTATIYVGAIDLDLSKTTNNSNPSEASSCPSANCFTYTLTAKNNSTATAATNVQIVDTLPVGIVYYSSTKPGGGQCAQAGQTITCAMGTLGTSPSASSTATATITVRADTGTGGKSLVNTATVSATEIDPDQSNNTRTLTVLVQSVDIQVLKTISPRYSPTGSGNPFTWTVTVTNKGLNTATNVKIKDVFATTYLNTGSSTKPVITVSAGTTWTAATSTWTIPTLNASTGTATMTIVASALNNALNGAPGGHRDIVNTATLDSVDKTDVNPSNNTASATVTISNDDSADLQIVKTVSPSGGVSPGQDVTYTFVVTNNGPKKATSVVVSDLLLKANAASSGSNFYFNYTGAGGAPPANWDKNTGKWTAFDLPAGQSQTFTMKLHVNGNIAQPLFKNTAHVTSAVTDQDSSNNDSEASLLVTWPSLVFVNAGGAGCNTDTFGDATQPNPGLSVQSWVPSQAYTAGVVTWGFYGNYVSNPPLAGFNYYDFNDNVVDAQGQNLLACTITGSNFNFRIDGMLTGLYDVTLLFADPANATGTHRFRADFLTYKARTKRLLVNYDATKDIETFGQELAVINGNAHYIARTYTVRVRGSTGNNGWLRLHFYNGRRARKPLYQQTYAMLSGLGITYVGP